MQVGQIVRNSSSAARRAFAYSCGYSPIRTTSKSFSCRSSVRLPSLNSSRSVLQLPALHMLMYFAAFKSIRTPFTCSERVTRMSTIGRSPEIPCFQRPRMPPSRLFIPLLPFDTMPFTTNAFKICANAFVFASISNARSIPAECIRAAASALCSRCLCR